MVIGKFLNFLIFISCIVPFYGSCLISPKKEKRKKRRIALFDFFATSESLSSLLLFPLFVFKDTLFDLLICKTKWPRQWDFVSPKFKRVHFFPSFYFPNHWYSDNPFLGSRHLAMMVLQFLQVGLINIASHATPTKELHWLLSVFVGIIMCKIVYDLTGFASSILFEGYAKLKDSEKLNWKNRGFSTVHALIVAATSLYLLTVSDLFDDASKDDLIVNRTSKFSDTILGISIGYFLTDLAMIVYCFPTLGGMEFVLHHGLSMFSIIQSLLSGQGLIYILMVLFSESTTPSVNLRWYLDVAGQKNSKLYIYNGVVLFFGWLVARILLFVYFFYHMFTHFDQVKKIYPLGFYSLLTVSPVLTMMNIFWFWKIARGLIKTLTKGGHNK